MYKQLLIIFGNSPLILIPSSAFFGVYSMAVDTLFLCFLEDLERNDGSQEKPYYMSTLVPTTEEDLNYSFNEFIMVVNYLSPRFFFCKDMKNNIKFEKNA